jgi:HK97 family phage major capsid protein
MNLAEMIAEAKAKIEEKRTAFNKFVSDAKVKAEADDLTGAKEFKSKAEAAKTELSALETRLNELNELAKLNPIAAPAGEQRHLPGDLGVQESQEEQEKREQEQFQKSYKPTFLRMLRGGMAALDADQRSLIQEGHIKSEKRDFTGISGLTGGDGGYTIPQDISTAINTLVQTLNPLQPLINTQNVQTRTGTRVIEQRATFTPFANVAEAGTIAATDKPTLEQVSYAIKDYAGQLPLTNDVLADSDANLSQYIASWFAKKSVVTRNSLILAILQAKAAVDLAGTDDIKKALNVTLDPGISQQATIVVNQTGFNFLDQLKDGEGRYLLQPMICCSSDQPMTIGGNPITSAQKMLFGRPIFVASQLTLPDVSASVAPIFIGDLKEAVILWDRQQQSIATNPYNDSSWNTNTVSMRAIEREDVTAWDDEAFINGHLTLA